MTADLSKIKCFLLDMDGTVYLSDRAFCGAAEAVARMRKQAQVMFLTNNTSVPTSRYFDKLSRMGFAPALNEIYGAGGATIDYLRQYHDGRRVYLLGSDELAAEFAAAGINIVNSDPQVVVFAFDKTLTYQKLAEFCAFVRGGAFFVATHPDLTCPTDCGAIPDVGLFLRLVYSVTGRRPNVVCGKPSRQLGARILARTGLSPHEICMVGDRLTTDMLFAHRCGFVSALVLSGEAKLSDLKTQKRQPDFVFDHIADWDTL